ncbi:alpha/beta hydrolase [Pseudomonas sp. C2L12B]|nr:alpha/beta hydrolase [Pseudomonas typographi]MBD1587935.1 alpha/beta hydrolase [Pseudomonas typographi]
MAAYALSEAMQAFVERTCSFASKDPSLAAQREAYLRMAAAFTPPMPTGLVQTDHTPHGGPPLRSYRPAQPCPPGGWPTLMYLHGGGWTLGNLDSHDFICRPLALALGAQVVAVDYRLAPEHPYPAALEDAITAWRYLCAQPHVDAQAMLVAGDSAGGNLAAALCLALRPHGGPQPCGQALIYPLLGPGGTPAYREHAHAPLLCAEDAQACLRAYLGTPAAQGALALPLQADTLAGLPAAFIGVAQIDPLRDDGALYRDRLAAQGVAVEWLEVAGWLHGGLRAQHSEQTRSLVEAMLAWMAQRLAAARQPAQSPGG